MLKKIKLETAEDLRKFVNLAWECPSDVGVHTSEDGIADAKSILGLISLDFTKPVMVVTEDERFFAKLTKWIVD